MSRRLCRPTAAGGVTIAPAVVGTVAGEIEDPETCAVVGVVKAVNPVAAAVRVVTWIASGADSASFADVGSNLVVHGQGVRQIMETAEGVGGRENDVNDVLRDLSRIVETYSPTPLLSSPEVFCAEARRRSSLFTYR
jgi:hypothetical protein